MGILDFLSDVGGMSQLGSLETALPGCTTSSEEECPLSFPALSGMSPCVALGFSIVWSGEQPPFIPKAESDKPSKRETSVII